MLISTQALRDQRGADGMGVLVAVLDTGVAITHTDLAAQIWQNPLEIANNGIDDDNNGFIDDINGGNSVWRDGNVNDVDGHGTACAGLIAASPNNEGLVGLAPNATILPVRILEKGEEGSFVSHAADGIVYAVDQGARVLSNSWTTGTGKKRLITEAIEYAHTNNALFVASAGNSPIDADEEGFFLHRATSPMSYRSPLRIALETWWTTQRSGRRPLGSRAWTSAHRVMRFSTPTSMMVSSILQAPPPQPLCSRDRSLAMVNR